MRSRAGRSRPGRSRPGRRIGRPKGLYIAELFCKFLGGVLLLFWFLTLRNLFFPKEGLEWGWRDLLIHSATAAVGAGFWAVGRGFARDRRWARPAALMLGWAFVFMQSQTVGIEVLWFYAPLALLWTWYLYLKPRTADYYRRLAPPRD